MEIAECIAAEPDNLRNFYECIYENDLQRMYIDIDVNVDPENPPFQPEEADNILQQYLDAIRLAFLVYGGEKFADIDLVVCCSSLPGIKYSWHINTRNVYFQCNTDVQMFVMSIKAQMDITIAQYIDFSVYGKFRQFRLTGCTKFGSPRVKKIVTEHTFEDTLVTHVIPDPVIFDHEKINQVYDMGMKKGIPRVKKLRPRNFQHIYTDTLVKYIIKTTKKWCEKNNIQWVHTYRGIFGNVVHFYRTAPSHCPKCNRVHDNDNTFLVQFNQKGEIYHHCWRQFGHGTYIGKLSDKSMCLMKKLLIEREIQGRSSALTLFDELPNDRKTVYSADTMNDYEEDKQTLCVRAGMGLGKTVKLLEHINATDYGKIIVISFRRTFTAEIKRRFGYFVSYADIRDHDIDIDIYNYLIIQVESLHRLHVPDWNDLDNTLVIMDESESILSQFSAPTFRNLMDCFSTFKNLLKTASNVIAMDANMSDRTYRTLDKYRPNSIYYHNNTYKRFTDHTCYLTHDKDELTAHMTKSVIEGKKIVVSTNSCKYAKAIGEKLSGVVPTGKNKVLVLCGDSDETKRQQIFANVNDELVKYDVVIYTPTLTAGVSFEKVHFDLMYCYYTDMSCDGLIGDQMMGRIRNIGDKKYYVGISSIISNLPISIKVLREYVARNRAFLKQEIGCTLPVQYEVDGNGEVILPADDYLDLWLENISITNKFRNNFISEFIPILSARGCKLEALDNSLTLKTIMENKQTFNKCTLVGTAAENKELFEAQNIDQGVADLLANQKHKRREEQLALSKYYFAKHYNKLPEELTLDFITPCNSESAKRHYRNLWNLKGYKTVEYGLRTLKNRAELSISETSKETIEYMQNEYAHRLIQACGFDNVLDTKTLRIRTIHNSLQKHAHLFNPESIRDYKLKYGSRIYRGYSANNFKQKIGMINTIIYFMYGYNLSNRRSTRGKELAEDTEDTYKIITNKLELSWEFLKKYKEENFEGDDIIIVDDTVMKKDNDDTTI